MVTELEEIATRMAISALPKHGGIFKSKRDMEAKSSEMTFDIGVVKTRTNRLRKEKPDVFMQYIKAKEGFEKIGRYKQIKGNYSPTKIK